MRRSSQTKSNLRRCRRRKNGHDQPQRNPTAEAKEAEICKEQGGRFFGCYLLTSLSPRYKGHSYIGFTVNPKRRIRQHNGEITSGASHTRRKRPWEMVFCIHGFPTQVAALQFEWAWQHPRESLAVRETASSFKSLGGLANKIKLALTMLTLPSWQSMDLTVSFFSTKHMNHTADCPCLPSQMKLHFCSMDELPCYRQDDDPYGFGDKDGIHSKQTEDFSDLDDDVQVSSVADINTGHSSVDVGRFSIPCVGESMQGDSYASVDNTIVEEEDLTDVCMGNNTTEKAKEMDTFQGDSSEKEESSHLHPALEGDTGIHRQFLSDVLRSAGSSMNEQMQLSKEIWTEEQLNPSTVVGELGVPVDKVDLSKGESLSRTACNSSKEDDMTCILINESNEEHRHPMSEHFPVKVGDGVQPIEIIDLFTPSPDCRIISGSKKRKAPRDHPDIIDLTRSPLFVISDPTVEHQSCNIQRYYRKQKKFINL